MSSASTDSALPTEWGEWPAGASTSVSRTPASTPLIQGFATWPSFCPAIPEPNTLASMVSFLWYLAQEFAAHCICEIPCISTGINICRAGIWTHGSWVRRLNANPVIYYFPSMVRGEKKLQSLIPAFRYQRGSQNNWCLMLRTRYSNSP